MTTRLTALLVFAVLLPAASAAWEGERKLTLADIFDPDAKLDFDGDPPSKLEWVDDDRVLWKRSDPPEGEPHFTLIDTRSGERSALFDEADFLRKLAALPGLDEEELSEADWAPDVALDAAFTAIVVPVRGDLYRYTIADASIARLTTAAGDEELASFSKSGELVAFVRDNDLFVVDSAGREVRLTTDGHGELQNGKLDYVYMEEIYGRGNFKGYWWSPDGGRIAFLQLDESGVPRYTLVDDIPYRPTIENWHYPKAGDPNPRVRLGVASVAGGEVNWVDLDPYHGKEILIVDVSWTPDSKQVVYQVQDREQTWLDLNRADARSGDAERLLRETTEAWVDVHGAPTWLEDGSFLWFSEHTGFKHIYHHAASGERLAAVTSGEWEAREIHGVGEDQPWVFFSGTRRDPIAVDVYRVRLDGSEIERLSGRETGTHTATFNPSKSMYVDSWSDLTTPPELRAHRNDGSEIRSLDDANPVDVLAEFRLSRPERLQVATSDGFEMEALLIKPPDFDPTRRYPVFQATYAGPHAPRVRDAWGGSRALFWQLLAQQGVVVWLCDNRSASGKSARSTWANYKSFGESELSDIEDCLSWLKQQPWVDADRIGIGGWSFGGFMVTYALTHSESFAMGIAGGSVTDWRNYDSIYTERYMLKPQNNPDGYEQSGPRHSAANLHGKLLLIHGALDDNVHPQNTMQFAHELQKAGKPFRLMLYPKSHHGVRDEALVFHLRQMMLDFVRETLLDPDDLEGHGATEPRSLRDRASEKVGRR